MVLFSSFLSNMRSPAFPMCQIRAPAGINLTPSQHKDENMPIAMLQASAVENRSSLGFSFSSGQIPASKSFPSGQIPASGKALGQKVVQKEIPSAGLNS